jgi:hypothetical protein
MTKTENGQCVNPEQINYIMIYYARDVICVIQHVDVICVIQHVK